MVIAIKEIIMNIKLPNNWILSSIIDNDISVNILETKQLSPHIIKETIELIFTTNTPEYVISKLKNNPNILDIKIIYSNQNHLIICLTSIFNNLYKILADFNVFLSSIRNLHNGWSELIMIIPNNKVLKKILKRFHEIGIKIHVKSITYVKNKTTLTSKQDNIIRLAYELGYYDYPRRISLTDLARKLNLSPATVAEILRRGEHRIIFNYITGKNMR
jgi:predicted DNA binding protein